MRRKKIKFLFQKSLREGFCMTSCEVMPVWKNSYFETTAKNSKLQNFRDNVSNLWRMISFFYSKFEMVSTDKKHDGCIFRKNFPHFFFKKSPENVWFKKLKIFKLFFRILIFYYCRVVLTLHVSYSTDCKLSNSFIWDHHLYYLFQRYGHEFLERSESEGLSNLLVPNL